MKAITISAFFKSVIIVYVVINIIFISLALLSHRHLLSQKRQFVNHRLPLVANLAIIGGYSLTSYSFGIGVNFKT